MGNQLISLIKVNPKNWNEAFEFFLLFHDLNENLKGNFFPLYYHILLGQSWLNNFLLEKDCNALTGFYSGQDLNHFSETKMLLSSLCI